MLTKISLEHNLFPIKLNSPQNQNQNTTVAPNNIPPVEHTEPTSGTLSNFFTFQYFYVGIAKLGLSFG
jgi:hypothetical protein